MSKECRRRTSLHLVTVLNFFLDAVLSVRSWEEGEGVA